MANAADIIDYSVTKEFDKLDAAFADLMLLRAQNMIDQKRQDVVKGYSDANSAGEDE